MRFYHSGEFLNPPYMLYPGPPKRREKRGATRNQMAANRKMDLTVKKKKESQLVPQHFAGPRARDGRQRAQQPAQDTGPEISRAILPRADPHDAPAARHRPRRRSLVAGQGLQQRAHGARHRRHLTLAPATEAHGRVRHPQALVVGLPVAHGAVALRAEGLLPHRARVRGEHLQDVGAHAAGSAPARLHPAGVWLRADAREQSQVRGERVCVGAVEAPVRAAFRRVPRPARHPGHHDLAGHSRVREVGLQVACGDAGPDGHGCQGPAVEEGCE